MNVWSELKNIKNKDINSKFYLLINNILNKMSDRILPDPKTPSDSE